MASKIIYSQEDLKYNEFLNINIINTEIIIKSNYEKMIKFFDEIDVNKIDSMNCCFKCENDINIILLKKSGLVECIIKNFNDNNLQILNNLPNFINTLSLENSLIFNDNFYNSLKNLPITLNKINIIYGVSLNKVEYYESLGYFNILFELKVPFDCKVEVITDTKTYRVIYENDFANKLKIVDNAIDEIYIIKKVKNKGKIEVDYIYLSSEERRGFAQVGHEYLINQV